MRLFSEQIACKFAKNEGLANVISALTCRSIAGYIWKDQDDGIQSLLRDDELPLDKVLLETDAPFMFPFVDKVCACVRLVQFRANKEVIFTGTYTQK